MVLFKLLTIYKTSKSDRNALLARTSRPAGMRFLLGSGLKWGGGEG